MSSPLDVASARAGLAAMSDSREASRGLKEGTKSIEVDQLAVARQTIEEPEPELAAFKAANALRPCLSDEVERSQIPHRRARTANHGDEHSV